MMNIKICTKIAFILWLMPFLIRFALADACLNINTIDSPKWEKKRSNSIENQLVDLFNKEDKCGAFSAIFTNNIKGCFLNISSGALIGIGTILNLATNGFYSADIIKNSLASGMSVKEVLQVTLPHSFELLGFWLSGAIGFAIAWRLILFMRGKEEFTLAFFKQVGLYSAVVFIIILCAAYIEAYVTVNML